MTEPEVRPARFSFDSPEVQGVLRRERSTSDAVPQMSRNAHVRDPGSKFAMTPDHVTTFAAFMFKQGLTKTKPETWKDMFFPEVHGQPGS